jgi:hypothetical protein
MPRVRLRARGEHYLAGEIKNKLIIYAYDHPEGLEEMDFRQFLLDKFGITDKESRDDHLDYFLKHAFLIRDRSGGRDIPEKWKPSDDIVAFKKLWLDRENRIWLNANLDDLLKFLSTKRVSEFIETKIVPAFVDYPVSKTFKGNELYTDLPSRSSPKERKDLEKICIWACKSCPLLVSHLFKPNKQVLLCITMILHNYLELPHISESESKSTNVVKLSRDFRQIIEFVRDDWYKIRFSKEVSKEMICLLTMLICFFIHLERNREGVDAIYAAREYQQLWELFSKYMSLLTSIDSKISLDAVKVIFTLNFADELFRQSEGNRGGRNRLIVF